MQEKEEKMNRNQQKDTDQRPGGSPAIWNAPYSLGLKSLHPPLKLGKLVDDTGHKS